MNHTLRHVIAGATLALTVATSGGSATAGGYESTSETKPYTLSVNVFEPDQVRRLRIDCDSGRGGACFTIPPARAGWSRVISITAVDAVTGSNDFVWHGYDAAGHRFGGGSCGGSWCQNYSPDSARLHTLIVSPGPDTGASTGGTVTVTTAFSEY